MAKTRRGFSMNEDGSVTEFAHKVTRHQRKGESQLIPWTAGPQTRWQKIKRAAVG